MAGPLKNIKVLDLSRVLAGPWGGQILADMGADVIKVEHPKGGDTPRGWGPPFLKDDKGVETSESAYFLSTNRGKRSIAIDISSNAGQGIVRKLADDADIVLENYKVGGLKKYGLDYDSLSKLNPSLIYCSITGFGQDGPRAAEAGYDSMIQARGGLMSFTGSDGGAPVKVGTAVADLTTGMYSVIAILGALHHRNATGQGQYIDMALLDVQASWLANQATNYLIGGEQPKRRGNAHPNIVPYQDFKTSDGYIIVAVGTDSQFEKLVNLIDLPTLCNADQFKTNRQRVEGRDNLVPVLLKPFLEKTSSEWLALLDELKIPAGPVNTLAEAYSDPQIVHRKLVRTIKHPYNDKLPQVATPIKYSKTDLEYNIPPPLLGQHTDEILTQLGFLEDEIKALREKGVVA